MDNNTIYCSAFLTERAQELAVIIHVPGHKYPGQRLSSALLTDAPGPHSAGHMLKDMLDAYSVNTDKISMDLESKNLQQSAPSANS